MGGEAAAAGLGSHQGEVFEGEELPFILAVAGIEKLDVGLGFIGDELEVRLFVEESVRLVEDEFVDDKALRPDLFGFPVFVDGGEDGLFVGDAGPDGSFEVLLFGNVDHFVRSVFMEDQELVEVGAGKLGGA